jgi:hypothetical protein
MSVLYTIVPGGTGIRPEILRGGWGFLNCRCRVLGGNEDGLCDTVLPQLLGVGVESFVGAACQRVPGALAGIWTLPLPLAPGPLL